VLFLTNIWPTSAISLAQSYVSIYLFKIYDLLATNALSLCSQTGILLTDLLVFAYSGAWWEKVG